jgi:phage terminase large subunit GpA-like protein
MGQDIILALKGWEGWGRPAIGTPSLVDINLAGRQGPEGRQGLAGRQMVIESCLLRRRAQRGS